jgi:AraC family transcriptional regulator of adaptative response/methylated-DNA-[protein]-cysteine methyltransferase
VSGLIDRADRPPTLAQLAAAVHLSPFHLQRRFKQATGITPREYADALRRRRVAQDLARARTVTDAGLAAGYGSTARLYADAPAALGMTPGEYAGGAAGLPIRAAVARCSLGQVLVATTDRGVCAILLGDDADALRADLSRRFPQASISTADRGFATLLKRVVALVEDPARGTELTLDVRGTAFQQRVWQALRQVACGETVSYAELARRIGMPQAARAVAAACAANALAVAIPCHRVVRGDGSLSGYRWGTERKRALLARESGDGSLRKR